MNLKSNTMKGGGSHSSDSDSESTSSYSTSDSESTCSYSSSSSSACKRKRKRRRRSSEHENENGRRSHNKKRSKNDHKNIELKKSGSSREDATKEKTKKCSRRRFAMKSTCESSYSEDERIHKKKRKAKEKRKKNKLKKKNKGEINQQKESCNLEMLHENVCGAGRRYEENSALQAMVNAKEQQKAIIQQKAELAKARLESGELQRARNEQMKMQDLYGTVDWRAKKKLRKEKRILERTVATGRKLASLDERETARMDAFRIAVLVSFIKRAIENEVGHLLVGLPTAEAQRQAEWRAYATESLAELSEGQKSVKSTTRLSKVIGPSLPRS